jgi:FeoB-associated Cys-rich membrane protein
MDWQLALVGLIIIAATAYIARRAWRTWGRKASGCGGGCGSGCKSAAPSIASGQGRLIPLEQITVRRGRE